MAETTAAGKPAQLRVHCNHCHTKTQHEVFDHRRGPVFDDDVETGFWEAFEYDTIQCCGCRSVVLRRGYTNAGYGVDKQGNEVVDYDFFPSPEKRPSRLGEFFQDMPDKLRGIYKETLGSYNGDNFVLCAVGLRALVEGLCDAEGIVDGPRRDSATGQIHINSKTGQVLRSKKLDGKIEGLAEAKRLTEQQAAWLHQNRFLGNDAVHTLDRPSEKVLDLAIDIVEHLLRSVYGIPHKAKTLEALRTTKKKVRATK